MGWEREKLKLVTNQREENNIKEKDAETHWANEHSEDDTSCARSLLRLLKCKTTIHEAFFPFVNTAAWQIEIRKVAGYVSPSPRKEL